MRLAATLKKISSILDSYSIALSEQYRLGQVELAKAEADKEAAAKVQQAWQAAIADVTLKAKIATWHSLTEILLQRLLDKHFGALELKVEVTNGEVSMRFDERVMDSFLIEIMTLPLNPSASVVTNVSVPPSVTNVSVPSPKPVEVVRGADGQIVGLNPLA